jgi:sarcosine oxidase
MESSDSFAFVLLWADVSMSGRYDVIVVGVGAMGAAACYHLARAGVRVLGLEQFEIPHAKGSSHGYSRMIRLAYYEHPDYVPLLRRAYQLWAELEQNSGQKLLHLTGGIYMGRPDGGVVSGALSAARRHGLAHELLDRAKLAERFGQLSVPQDHVGVWEPQAGFLLPERTIAAHAEGALRAGAELHGHEAVAQWESDDGGVTVRTGRGEYRADRIIFCGGAWSGRLVRDLGVELLVTRQVLGWVWPKRPELFELGKLPVWAVEQPDGGLAYGFPMMPDNPGLKIALHARGKPTEADRLVRDILPGDEDEVRGVARRYVPDGDGPLLALRVCMYTNSPDSHFIIDRHPRHPRVIVACGFSGHGFKFSSVIGEVLADLARNGKTELPIGFLGLNRFKDSSSPSSD